MDKQPIHNSSRFKKFINGWGFYVALGACLVAVGGIGLATFGGNLFGEKVPENDLSTTEPVEQIVQNQPDERKTTTTPTETTTTTTTTTESKPVPAADLFVLPLTNTVQKAYSGDSPAYSITMKNWSLHTGTDFVGEKGQSVKALADGKVTQIGEDPLWGETLTVDHGVEVLSVYYGVHPTVAVGDSVHVGQEIGKLTDIPCEVAQGPHLHLEMIIDGERADPVTAIGREVRYVQNDEEN